MLDNKIEDSNSVQKRAKITSKEVLRLIIELLQQENVAMNFNQIEVTLRSKGINITEGQILNVQNKVKANKVAELKIIRDEKGHILMTASSVADVVNTTVDSCIAKINSNLKLNLDELNDDDKQKLIAKLNDNTEILTNMLKTAKQS